MSMMDHGIKGTSIDSCDPARYEKKKEEDFYEDSLDDDELEQQLRNAQQFQYNYSDDGDSFEEEDELDSEEHRP